MRIVVNDIAASKGGAMTVLKDFYQCVRENDTENEWIFLLGDNYLEPTDNIRIITLPEIKKSWIKRFKFDLFSGKKYISELKPDVYFSMQNTVAFGLKAPQIIYMHQPVPFQDEKSFSFFKGSERSLAVYQHILGLLIKKSVRRADRVVVQTEWVKKAVAKKCRIDESKILKVHPIVKDVSEYIDKSAFVRNSFFYPTSTALYKNNDLLIKASEILSKEGIEHSVVMTLAEENSSGNVKCVGRLPYEEVLGYYNKSTLVFPSYIETFGYPMAEAAKMGDIVLASDCAFSREVLAGYDNAYFFNHNDAGALATLMGKVASGEIIRKDIEHEDLDSGEKGWLPVLNAVIGMADNN